MATDYSKEPAVVNLQNYLRIRSVQPNVNYDECIAFLKAQATALGLPVKVYEQLPKKPVLVITWAGKEPSLPAVLLNSHMDVVPVFEASWKYPPFDAHIENGVIYGRGVQDMKSVGIQYLETVKRLKNKGVQLKRTVHLSFMPDEEIGGSTGMSNFVKTNDFKALNVGFSLDEGIASPTNEYLVYNKERTIWHLNVVCPGKSGHGSMLLPDNCGEKVRYIIDKFMDYRAVAKKKLESNSNLNIGDVTSVNLTMLSGGIQENVVPEKFTATFDIRLAFDEDLKKFEDMVRQWCTEAGADVSYNFSQKDPFVPLTPVDNSSPFWLAFKSAADELKLSLKICTFPGGTDSRSLRALGIPALGFSPMANTEPLLHQHNENLKLETFINGIQIYEKLIPAVANV